MPLECPLLNNVVIRNATGHIKNFRNRNDSDFVEGNIGSVPNENNNTVVYFPSLGDIETSPYVLS